MVMLVQAVNSTVSKAGVHPLGAEARMTETTQTGHNKTYVSSVSVNASCLHVIFSEAWVLAPQAMAGLGVVVLDNPVILFVEAIWKLCGNKECTQ